MSLTRQLAQLAHLPASAVPAAALRIADLSIFDWFACTQAGLSELSSRAVRALVSAEAGAAQATLAGGDAGGKGARVPARAAALANGTASHALDYDDTIFGHVAHPSVAVLPAALGAAESEGATVEELRVAFVLGVEASCRLGRHLGAAHYNVGFHQTATAGAFGAAVASARLLGLSEGQTVHALGLVSTRASGLRNQFGSDGKPYNAGLAASNGVEAAALARLGFTSHGDGVGGSQGYVATHHGAGGSADADAGAGDGAPPPPPLLLPVPQEGRFFSEEVSYKFHACCHGTHAMIEALLALRAQHADLLGSAAAADVVDVVERIEVRTAPRWMGVCNLPAPRTGLEAKFSYRLLAALTLLGVDTGRLDSYCEGNCARPDALALRERVHVVGAPEVAETAAEVRVELRGGGAALVAQFDLAEPVGHEELQVKLLGKVGALVGAAKAERLWENIALLPRSRPAQDLWLA